ncbi:sn-glycerol-3-phosphate ABC transporter ATP-binding protein UgpC [Psychromarinibacter sp. C21-152]|uniref:Sn-glycerol-3-phosphate ABC transporter ATP-binding protein UgpC n=1 Tax=Psychromarinibacter sediminicola TaxID=3033385 RepID=A0AAE3NME2_9RHOB|nr:sn-glycerol-3-phosphate ABC transporter ATP-binding protein UgpC [Psychromarinibacter sediminicola]MDF0599998.1 sn-glycerol-3-phosphate ABC transporter ATP-binding protein UgpC [Psychromarinibacter sediminicola]
MAYLTLEKLRKAYGKHVVIPEIDLELEAGEFVCLVGPSGSGKSTLLRMIAGLESISGGRVTVAGADITGTDPSDRDMAMVFQSYALYPHMTVRDNMSFALRMRNEDKALIQERVAEAVEMLDLHGLEDRKPSALSGGQRQRVAMGRCIVRKPKLFLFDEPLSNLDAKLRTATRHQIRRLHDQLGATSIFVTHDQVEAMTMADRIALLDHGEVMQIGTPQELYLNPKNRFTAGFLGSPEMNFFSGTAEMAENGLHVRASDSLFLPASDARLKRLSDRLVPGQTVEVGVRPEHFVIADAPGPDTLSLPVEGQEWLGHEAFVFGRIGKQEVGVRVASGAAADDTLPRTGSAVPLTVLEDTWHVFDPETGETLSL